MRDAYNALVPYPAPVATDLETPAGPLAGLTFVVKDIFDVAGYPTGCGNPVKLAQSGIATTTAPAAARLAAAGAGLAAKAQTDELAWSILGRNPHFGPVANPAAPDRIIGGSSCGSAAAVAGGLADFAIGSDTGGSVRAPASFGGTWGLRPTWGRAPLDGCMPVAPSFDTCGLFARDGAVMLAAATALLGPDEATLRDAPLRAATDMFDRVAPAARLALTPLRSRLAQAETALYVNDPSQMHECFDILQAREMVASQGAWISAMNPPLGEMVRLRFAAALQITMADEITARAARTQMLTRLLDRLDGAAVLAPVAHDAPIATDADTPAFLAFGVKMRHLLCVAGIGGLPQVVFPAARVDGAPIGLSLIGPPGTDLALIAMAIKLTTEANTE